MLKNKKNSKNVYYIYGLQLYCYCFLLVVVRLP